MDYQAFTPISALIGGVCVGLAAMILLKFVGKICGISGIIGQAVTPNRETLDRLKPWVFIVGLIVGGWLGYRLDPAAYAYHERTSLISYGIAGLLVGYGTRLGSGCTSGHGICGIGRFSVRSIVATCVFMATGTLTVFLLRTCVWGGGL